MPPIGQPVGVKENPDGGRMPEASYCDRTVRRYLSTASCWASVRLARPAIFDTMALKPGGSYSATVGRAWHWIQRFRKSRRPSVRVAPSACWRIPARRNEALIGGADGGVVSQPARNRPVPTATAKTIRAEAFTLRMRNRISFGPGDPVRRRPESAGPGL